MLTKLGEAIVLFQGLGFERLSSDTIAGYYKLVHQSENVFVHCRLRVDETDEVVFRLTGGNLKYFGEIRIPEMNVNRPIADIQKMIGVMQHYILIIDQNQPW